MVQNGHHQQGTKQHQWTNVRSNLFVSAMTMTAIPTAQWHTGQIRSKQFRNDNPERMQIIHNGLIGNTMEPTLTIPVLQLLEYPPLLGFYFLRIASVLALLTSTQCCGQPHKVDIFLISCCPAVVLAFAGLEMPFVQFLT